MSEPVKVLFAFFAIPAALVLGAGIPFVFIGWLGKALGLNGF